MLTAEEELTHLRRMFESARALTRSEDPLLQGYYAHLYGRLAQLLALKDPETAYPSTGEPAARA